MKASRSGSGLIPILFSFSISSLSISTSRNCLAPKMHKWQKQTTPPCWNPFSAVLTPKTHEWQKQTNPPCWAHSLLYHTKYCMPASPVVAAGGLCAKMLSTKYYEILRNSVPSTRMVHYSSQDRKGADVMLIHIWKWWHKVANPSNGLMLRLRHPPSQPPARYSQANSCFGSVVY